jgi:hypothetical protein
LSPIPRMRISSSIRSRSGVILSSVMETSCQSIEKVPIVRQVRQNAKCAEFRSDHDTGHTRHCRASGFVLGPEADMVDKGGYRTFAAIRTEVCYADKDEAAAAAMALVAGVAGWPERCTF